MKVKDVIEGTVCPIFYPDWKLPNTLRVYKTYKLEIFHKLDYISCTEIVLMGKVRPLMSKSYSIDKQNGTVILCDNVIKVQFKTDAALITLNVDDNITAIISRIEFIQECK